MDCKGSLDVLLHMLLFKYVLIFDCFYLLKNCFEAYFAICGIESWSSNLRDGYFNLISFHKNIVRLFEDFPDDEWVGETLDYITG
jgi:hypothetical protein